MVVLNVKLSVCFLISHGKLGIPKVTLFMFLDLD